MKVNKKVLAEELREKQIAFGEVSDLTIMSLSDDDIIDAYITCSECGEKIVDQRTLMRIIFKFRDVDDFFRVCNMYGNH